MFVFKTLKVFLYSNWFKHFLKIFESTWHNFLVEIPFSLLRKKACKYFKFFARLFQVFGFQLKNFCRQKLLLWRAIFGSFCTVFCEAKHFNFSVNLFKLKFSWVFFSNAKSFWVIVKPWNRTVLEIEVLEFWRKNQPLTKVFPRVFQISFFMFSWHNFY